MEEVNRLIKGLNTDVHPSMQPENTMRDCWNFVPMDTGGNAFAVTNESGTVLMDNIVFPTGFSVIGSKVLDNDIIVILAHADGYSQVGYIREDGTTSQYHAVAPYNPATLSVPNNNSEFGFSLLHPVDCEARKLINGNRILYYTDNNVPFGQVNLDNPPEVGSVISTSSLAFTQKVPYITITNINENVASTIKAGAVQFTTRYVTSAGDTTNFGLASNLISLTKSYKIDGVDQYEGAYATAGTIGKSLDLTITNVDTQYNELELIAIYYEDDILKACVVETIPISTDEIVTTYTGPVTEGMIDLTLEELRKMSVSYTKAKCIAQKDNTLFLSNLSSPNTGNDEMLQRIANKVEVSYSVHEIPFSNRGETGDQDFTDYVEELNTLEKGYRRNEVYSLGFYLLYKDGTKSYNYHIPGKSIAATTVGKKPSPTWVTSYRTGEHSAILGTFISTVTYPNNQQYPGNTTSGDDNRVGIVGPTGLERNVRHHLMPSLEIEPHYRVSSGTTYIRTLDLSFNFTENIPTNILASVDSIVFTRERRNTAQNKSLHAQGIINRMVASADDYNNDSYVDNTVSVGGIPTGYIKTEMPLFNNLESISFTGDQLEWTSAHTNGGVAYPNFTNNCFPTGTYAEGTKLNTEIFNRHIMFHSPETDLNTESPAVQAENFQGAFFNPSLILTGTYEQKSFGSDTWGKLHDSLIGTIEYLEDYMYADYHGSFKNYATSPLSSLSKPSIVAGRTTLPSVDRVEEALDISNLGFLTSTRWSNGGFEAVCNTDFSEEGGTTFSIKNNINAEVLHGINDGITVYDTSYTEIIEGSGVEATTGTLQRILYNLETVNGAQYSSIGYGEYIPIGRREAYVIQQGSVVFRTLYNYVGGGDTIISKYAFTNGNLIPYFPFTSKYGNLFADQTAINNPSNLLSKVGGDLSSHSENGRDATYVQIDEIIKGGGNNQKGTACGWDFRSTTYFFVESDINTNFRHNDGVNKYYPKNTAIDVLSGHVPYFGQNNQLYNNIYSYENTVITSYPKTSTTTIINSFENRTIYSEKASSDETLDSYRIIPQNYYYDLPAHTGPIWDSFVLFNQLFLHTPKSLWRTFAEPAATLQGANISDVVLGVGGLFARPSQEIFTATGGYGGTISQFGGVHSNIGYIFPDVLQGKIFGLVVGENGPYLKELSEEGMQSFYHINMPLELTSFSTGLNFNNVNSQNAYLIDNPFMGIGFSGGYDFKLKRFWIIKHPTYDINDDVVDAGFTLSYSTILNNWFSFHNYSPNLIWSLGNRTLFIQNNDVNNNDTANCWEMNLGEKGSYFNAPYPFPSKIKLSSAAEIGMNKVYQNLDIKSFSQNGTLKVRDDNFNLIQVYNDKMNSGELYLVPGNTFAPTKNFDEVFYKYRNDEYRVAIPRDSVIDNSDNINILTNLDSSQTFRERIKGIYANFALTYNNTDNYNFFLKQINIIFNKNIR